MVNSVKVVLHFEPFDNVTWHQPNWLAKFLQILFSTVVSIGPSRGRNSECRIQKYELSCHMKTELLMKM